MKSIKLLIIFTFFLAIITVKAQSSDNLTQKKCSAGETVLPARYDEHRFIVEPTTKSGKKLSFYTDTGGGLFIYKDSAERLNLIEPDRTDNSPLDFPTFEKNSAIPEPLGSNGKIYLLEKTQKGSQFINALDGMLGQAWFADRKWIFDYPNQKLILADSRCHTTNKTPNRTVELGFKTDDAGKRILSFPRITIEIDGEVIDMLFDTGATTDLTENALKILGQEKSASRATSFITSSMFEKWRKNNPNWRIIEKAELNTDEAMIEVPKIKIADYEVGPVWFTRRDDKNFHEYMTQFMDKKIEGAIGGNTLRFFKVTVDYPRATAMFEKE